MGVITRVSSALVRGGSLVGPPCFPQLGKLLLTTGTQIDKTSPVLTYRVAGIHIQADQPRSSLS